MDVTDEMMVSIVPGEDRSDDEIAQLRSIHGGYLDDNPFFLQLVLNDGRDFQIDLGGRGWIRKFSDMGVLREPGQWYLCRKEGGVIVLALEVLEGEQPYYVARHVGFASTDANTETTVYGIGKKRRDGHVDRLWIMANGAVLAGDDAETIALRVLKMGIMPSW